MTVQRSGSMIAGYRIESVIGRGGMAVVYRAEDLRLGRKVALKLLTPQLADSEQFRQRFIRESRLAASLDHPNIVPIYEAGEADGQLFIAMRYVLGSDLKGVLAEEGGPLPLARLLPLFVQIGDALDSAHRRGLVHRDVKPGNILVAAAEEHGGHAHPDHVYLTDFGLTKRTSELSGGLTGTGHFLGTVDYVSPEQIQGRPVGRGTDIYALGCVLYECLTGQLPFRRDDDAALLWAHLVEAPPPVSGIRPELPAAVNGVVARAMAKAPEDRHGSCQELIRDLEVALGLSVPLSSPGRRVRATDGGVSRAEAAASDSFLSHLDTVTGGVPGGGTHPSFPPGPLGRFPASHDRPGEPARRAEPPAEVDDELADAEEYFEPEEEAPDVEGDTPEEWDDSESAVAPPAGPPTRRRRWRLVAIAAVAAIVLVAGTALLLSSFWQPEDYRPYTSGDTLVPFRIDRPADWTVVVGAGSDVVLSPDPSSADDLFFLKGTPEAWASTGQALKSDSPDHVWAYVYTAASSIDNSSMENLRESLQPLLPATTQFESVHRELSVGGAPANELEAVTSDPQNPQTRLRALIDVVQQPESGGSVLLAFFAPPDAFDSQLPVFTRMRDSLELIG